MTSSEGEAINEAGVTLYEALNHDHHHIDLIVQLC